MSMVGWANFGLLYEKTSFLGKYLALGRDIFVQNFGKI